MPGSDIDELVLHAYCAVTHQPVELVRAMATVPPHLLAWVLLLPDADLHRLAGW